jgi:arsenate reductase
MGEVGIDMSCLRSKSVHEITGHEIDYVITICNWARGSAREIMARSERLQWPFLDPASFTETWEVRMEAFQILPDRTPARVMYRLGRPRAVINDNAAAMMPMFHCA